jgi:enoyl-CoA hydratase/carnithine racemase
VTRDDDVATLTLDRPERNLLHIELLEELNAQLLDVRNRPATKVLVIRGAGKAFCDGIDAEDLAPDRVTRLLHVFHRVFETLRMLDVILVAAVDGAARGGGFELALGCNLIVARESAVFALPEIRLGIIPPLACVVLPRVAPRRKAMEWILLGDDISATELERHGIVARVWADALFEEQLDRFVERLTEPSGPVLQLAKRAQLEAYYTTYEEALYKVENLYLRELMALRDPQEGVRASIEGRSPRWVNG